jgi:hypothetical protein
MQKKEEVAGAKAFGHKTYRKMNLQSRLQATEDETTHERATADKAAKKELSHLNKLNSEVRDVCSTLHECVFSLTCVHKFMLV